MLVQAFGPEPAIERFNGGVVGRLARAREVENNAALIRPEVNVARDELGALIDADRLLIATGTDQSRPTSRSRLSTKPVVCRSGKPNRTFIVRRVWMAVSL
ncbi:hypothetical protein GCM10011341_14060 [Frigidibacter albus]|nr:hypothetical protein GCM10011341_14060 [Frigidibacter albus]